MNVGCVWLLLLFEYESLGLGANEKEFGIYTEVWASRGYGCAGGGRWQGSLLTVYSFVVDPPVFLIAFVDVIQEDLSSTLAVSILVLNL